MSTLTLNAKAPGLGSRASVSGAKQAGKPGFATRLFTGMIASRQAQAERIVADHLSRFTDAQLIDLGYTPTHIAHLRLVAEKARGTALN